MVAIYFPIHIKPNGSDKEFELAYHKDHLLLTAMVEQTLLDVDLTVKDKVDQLGIISSSVVDTLEVLRVGAKNSLPSIVEQMEFISKYLTEKSGRRVEERSDFMMISAHDIQYLQDTPIGNGSFGDVFLGNIQFNLSMVARSKGCSQESSRYCSIRRCY